MNEAVVSKAEYILDKSECYPHPGESDAEFMIRVQKRQAERRSRMTPEELNRANELASSLEAAAKELGYL